jgi:hypothetical protein
LLGHAPGLKDQALAAGKLDGYFMLGRHRVLISVFSLGKLVWKAWRNGRAVRPRQAARRMTADSGACAEARHSQ